MEMFGKMIVVWGLIGCKNLADGFAPWGGIDSLGNRSLISAGISNVVS